MVPHRPRGLWEIRSGLYRSDLGIATDQATFAGLDIEVLVSLVTKNQWERRGLDTWSPTPSPRVWVVADVADDDVDPLPLYEWRRAVDAVVAAQREHQRCLVHCSAGRSRSGIALALAIARLDGCTVEEAVRNMKSGGLWRGAHPRLLAALAGELSRG